MASPSGRRRPLSSSVYEPLIAQHSVEKPKPPPKPKPQFLKAFSATALDPDTSRGTSGGYFQPGGASGIGYCLSSVYKTKRTSSDLHDDKIKEPSGERSSPKSPKSSDGKLKFTPKDGLRPSLISLPAKFRASFEERNRQSARKSEATSELQTNILIDLSDSDKAVVRRSPPLVPKTSKSNNRMSNPLPTTVNPSKSLPAQLTRSYTLSTSSSETSNLQRTSTASTVSPTTRTPSPASPALCSSIPPRPVTFAQPPPREMEYMEEEHAQSVFEYLEKFRHTGELCDATLLVNGRELKAHRIVLAACSQYFESMFIGEFAEPADESIVIEELSDDALESMITFAYTSRIKLTERNVHSIFEAADLLQFNGVKGACFKFFKQQINKSNCIRTWLFAKSVNSVELLDASLKYIEYNFLDIVRGREFLDTDQPDTVSDIICREDLAITSEEQVYEAVLAWVQRNTEMRKKYSLEVFKHVRFSSISKEYLMHIVDNEPLIKEDPDVLQLVRKYHL